MSSSHRLLIRDLHLLVRFSQYRPDELVPAGIGFDEPQAGTTSTTASTTESSTASTEVSEDSHDEEEGDIWPLELMM